MLSDRLRAIEALQADHRRISKDSGNATRILLRQTSDLHTDIKKLSHTMELALTWGKRGLMMAGLVLVYGGHLTVDQIIKIGLKVLGL